MKRIALVLSLCCLSSLVSANHPLVRNFSREVYKSGTQNWDICQDSQHAVYFANNEGLLEFDGKNWSTCPIGNNTNVRSIFYSSDGRIFAGATGEFGYYHRSEDGNLDYHSLIPKLNERFKTFNEVWNIHECDDRIYFQSDLEVFRYFNDTIRYIPFAGKIDVSEVISGVLFVASTSEGLFMLNGDLFVKIPGSDMLLDKKVVSILPFEENKILIVTSLDGVYMYDGNSIDLFQTGIDDFLRSNQVFCAASNGKHLVFGTVQRGIVLKSLINGTITYLNTFSGLQNNTVLSMKFDHLQNLWLGLDKGIDYVLLNNPVQNIFGSNNLYGAGYTSILRGNTLYFGTNQGLYKCSYPLSSSPLPLQLTLVKGMEGQVWCLTEIDNTLFCGNDRGAFIIKQNGIEQIHGIQGTWQFKKLQHGEGHILGCSYKGLFILKKEKDSWKLSHFIKGNFNLSSPIFEETGDSTIWFSHWQKGLFRLYLNQNADSIVKVVAYDEYKGFTKSPNNSIFRIRDEILISSEQGFFRFNNKNDRLEPYPEWNRMFTIPPWHMRLHQNSNGDVWCISRYFTGLAKKVAENSYRVDSFSYRILQGKFILGFEHFNFIDKDNVIVSSEDGFYWVKMNREPEMTNRFSIFIRSVEIATNNNTSIRLGRIGSQPLERLIRHNQNSLRFEFVAPEFRNEDMVKYSVMLENYDNSWSEFNQDYKKEYTRLPKGNYIFRVKAENLLEFQPAECSYSFTIAPAWYESGLAFIFYAVVTILFVISLIFWVNNRSKQGAIRMEKIKENEINEQKKQFEAETTAKKREIRELKNQQLQYELRHKSQELASSTMNLIRKNEILMKIIDNLSALKKEFAPMTGSNAVVLKLNDIEKDIQQNISTDDNWKRFEENFDLVYENYLKRLGTTFPGLTVADKKLCAYLKMDLSTKDIAPLMNMTIRSIEMSRYRLRKKMGLDRDLNLSEFLQKF